MLWAWHTVAAFGVTAGPVHPPLQHVLLDHTIWHNSDKEPLFSIDSPQKHILRWTSAPALLGLAWRGAPLCYSTVFTQLSTAGLTDLPTLHPTLTVLHTTELTMSPLYNSQHGLCCRTPQSLYSPGLCLNTSVPRAETGLSLMTWWSTHLCS